MERRKRFVIGDADVLGAPAIFQERMFGTDAWIIEAGGNRMRFGDLPVVIADHVGTIAVQHAGAPGRERRRMLVACQALARRFRTDDAYAAIIEERVEQADRIAAATDAGGDRIRQPTVV